MEIERLAFGLSHADKCRASHYKWLNVPPGIPPEMAIEFMARLNAGSTIGKLTSGKPNYGPAFVNYPRFKKHCHLHPTWGAEARKISEANVIHLKGALRKSLTHCRNGHAFSGDNLYVSPDGKERRCMTCMRFNGKFGRRVSEDQARRAIEALKAGALLTEICRTGAPSYVVTQRALQIFRSKNPKFDHLVAKLAGVSQVKRRDEAKSSRLYVRSVPITASAGADFFQLARNAVPASLPRQVREDAIGSMALDLAEGKLQPGDIRRRVQEYITAQFRLFSKFGPRSLDAPLSADGSATLMDVLSTDSGGGYWDLNMLASTGRQK
jgi:hypothetical protein